MKTLILSSSLSENFTFIFIICKHVFNILCKHKVDCQIIDARKIPMNPTHGKLTLEMQSLSAKIAAADNIIIGMGVHCYSVNDSLKILLDTCFSKKHILNFMEYYVRQEGKKFFIYYAFNSNMYE